MAFLSLKSNNLHESSLSTTVILLGEKFLECVSDAAGGGGGESKRLRMKRELCPLAQKKKLFNKVF